MSQILSDSNPFYTFKLIENSKDLLFNSSKAKDYIVSYYVLNGNLNFEIDKNKIELKDEKK